MNKESIKLIYFDIDLLGGHWSSKSESYSGRMSWASDYSVNKIGYDFTSARGVCDHFRGKYNEY